MRVRTTIAIVLALSLALPLTGCSRTRAGVDRAVKQGVLGGVETTTAGPHNVVPANDAQNAVDKLNNVQQTEQQAEGAAQ